jgi:TPP-dependent pyruvate/acetoin dehydrogenase alpha subunit
MRLGAEAERQEERGYAMTNHKDLSHSRVRTTAHWMAIGAAVAGIVLSLTGLTASASARQAPMHRDHPATWSGWSEVFGGGLTSDAPAAVNYHHKHFLFVRGTDDHIYVNRFDGSWTGWSEVPGGGLTLSAPEAAVYRDTLRLYVQGTDSRIYVNRLHN